MRCPYCASIACNNSKCRAQWAETIVRLLIAILDDRKDGDEVLLLKEVDGWKKMYGG